MISIKKKLLFFYQALFRSLLNCFEGGDQHVFSPSMLQVQQSSPSPLARAITWVVCFGLFVFVVWSLWAEFDISVSASGTAMASTRTKVIQALEVSRVASISVNDGDRVFQGQELISLDPTVAEADHEKTRLDTLDASLDIQRLKAQLDGRLQLAADKTTPKSSAFETQNHLLRSRTLEQQQKLALLAQEVTRKRAELNTTKATLLKVQAALPMLQQRLAMRERLLLDGYVAEMAVIDNRLEVSSQQHEAAVLQEKLIETEAALRSAELAQSQARAEYVARTSLEMTEARRRWQTGTQEFIKAAYRRSYQVLTSPIDGVVQQLAINTVGGVVNAGQGLMVVVPHEGGIEVLAQVPSRDIGFLRPGLPVAVKLDAFDFTKYGTLDGEVQWTGADAIKDDKAGQVFPVRIILRHTRLPVAVNGEHPALRIGMSVTADIAIGKRKAYEYFLGPLLKYKNESLREP